MTLDHDLIAAALPLYEVSNELGRGAWGVVLAGRHRELGRDVAIKQLPRAFGADPAVHARFVTEARLLASLDHTHIVRVYDFVEHGGLCLLVIERLTGGTVWSRFKSGAFTVQRSCAVGLASCAALEHAHQHGVLHRDVKPENLMFSAEAVLKITDFGIAKVIGGSETVATRAGDVLGTPAYMAPEQALGGALGPPTDIYSLATVLYELFSGRLPFTEDANPLATLYRHVHDKPQPLRHVAPHIPAGLAEVIDRALATQAADRYPTAEAFGVALGEAGAEGWGSRWLAESGIVVAATSPIASAAAGRVSETIVTYQPSAGWPGGSAFPPATSLGQPTPADLVPVNLLRPELFEPGPVVDATDIPAPSVLSALGPFTSSDGAAAIQAPRSPVPGPLNGPVEAATTEAPPAPGPLTGPEAASRPPSNPPSPSLPPAQPARRRRRLVIAGTALGVVGALVAVALVLLPGSSHHSSTGSSTQTSTAISYLQPAKAWLEVQPPMPTPRQQMGASVIDDDVILVVGGLTSATVATSADEAYDPSTSQWSTPVSLPLPLHHEMVVTYEDHQVVLGGWTPRGGLVTGTVSKKVYEHVPGKWISLRDMLDPRAEGAAAVVGDEIIVFGGVDKSGPNGTDKEVSVVDIYHDGKWSHSAVPMPDPRDHLAGVSDGQFVYAVGGRHLTANFPVGTVDRYDPRLDRWTKLNSLRVPRDGVAAAIVGGDLVTAGGERQGAVLGTVEILNLSTGTWSYGPSMPIARHGLVLEAVGSTLYAIGGATKPNHAGSTGAVEALDFTPG
jgi:serine/threonine protein kinase